ncbi:unnamed protein product [Ilex paraguariensis]|uniref:Uncharacterized protein n=1 Tax=Ilex paraguariensis TaxID=185542 RepID=A0ABC8TV12_9AQUA
MTSRKKYRPKVVDTSEKMKIKKSCSDPPSSFSKKKCNHPSSIDPTSTNPTSFNPVDPTLNHPPSSSNPNPTPYAMRKYLSSTNIANSVDIKKTDKAYNTLVKIFYSNMHDIDRDDHKFKSLVRNVSFEVTPNDTYSTPMNPIYGGTIKKSLGQGKKNKTQQSQPQVENEVEAKDDEAQTQDVPNSSTAGVPNSSTTSLRLDALQVYGMLLV